MDSSEWLKKAQERVVEVMHGGLKMKDWAGYGVGMAYGQVVSGLRFVVGASRKIDEEGTPLRGVFRSGRLCVNDVIGRSFFFYEDLRTRSAEAAAAVKRRTLFVDDALSAADDARHNKPEILVASFSATALALSFLTRRRRIILNTTSAAVASAAFVYGSCVFFLSLLTFQSRLWWEKRYGLPFKQTPTDDQPTKDLLLETTTTTTDEED